VDIAPYNSMHGTRYSCNQVCVYVSSFNDIMVTNRNMVQYRK